MAKLYIIGIGGTGSRILRSVTMLMAAGAKMNAEDVIPIIIDPDAANADLTRAVTLMNNYKSIRNHLTYSSGNQNIFFKTELTQILPNYLLKISNTDDRSFQQFIDYASMSKPNKALTKMLFSDKNLSSSMDVGFKGNPNIGSVVLNQIIGSDDFNTFANSFADGDKIFIISSIFGGTGASGFPLLLKTLRESTSFANHALLNNAEIGALTVLPYFRLQHNDDSEIDSSTFISKTKSALAYYENNIIKNQSINALYYLGDDITNTYANNEGGSAQQNDAHLIEFLGATAVFDFVNSSTQGTTNKELGLKDLQGSVSFDLFHDKQRRFLYEPLVQFTMFCNSMLDNNDYFTSSTFNANENFNGLYNDTFFSELISFFAKYREWLSEMKKNKRPLDLFNLDCKRKPFELVTGRKPRWIPNIKSDYDLVADRLNSAIRKCKSANMEDKFMEMFFIGTQKLIKDKL